MASLNLITASVSHVLEYVYDWDVPLYTKFNKNMFEEKGFFKLFCLS